MTTRCIPPLAVLLTFALLWEAAVRLTAIPEYLLPPPSIIVMRLFAHIPGLMPHIAVTSAEASLGFIFGSLVGILLATVFAHSRTLENGLYPYAIALKSIPIVAIAPLLVVWFGNGLAPKVIIAAIISFFPVVVNATRGFRSVPHEAIDLFQSLSASPKQIFLQLRLPYALPYIFSALRVSATLAAIGAIVGEFAGADRGLGFYIVISSHRFETTDMFVGVVLASLVGLLLFYAVSLLELVVAPWLRPVDLPY